MRYKVVWGSAEVFKVHEVANNVIQVDIKPENDTQFYSMGAHIDVTVFVNNQPETRSYSLVGKPKKDNIYSIAVKRLKVSKGGSKFMWTLKKGDRLQISQPMNHFELARNHSRVVLIAAGIGVTPILGMAQQLIEKHTPLQMVYLGASIKEMPYIKELKDVLGKNIEVYAKDEQGRRYDFKKLIASVDANTAVYMCGPLGMMNAVRSLWEQKGYPTENLRYETFGASGLFAPQKFKVKIPRFNLEVEVDKNQTLLEVLNSAGAPVMYDCNKGECGLCTVDILSCSGEVDHRDFFLSDHQKEENTKMCSCTSRVVNGDIVIDTAYRGK